MFVSSVGGAHYLARGIVTPIGRLKEATQGHIATDPTSVGQLFADRA